MEVLNQGEIIRLETPGITGLVLSRAFFNRSGMAVVCPVAAYAPEDALHIPVTGEKMKGVALLEHLKSLDLRTRFYERIFPTQSRESSTITHSKKGQRIEPLSPFVL